MTLKTKEALFTVVAVLITGLLCFGGAALYDQLAGGPEAREASVDAKAVLEGFKDIQQRSECVTSYTNADNVSQALLLIAFGEIIETASLGEPITREQTNAVHSATIVRIRYLILKDQVNDLCDPKRPGGPKPLPEEDKPLIPDELVSAVNNGD